MSLPWSVSVVRCASRSALHPGCDARPRQAPLRRSSARVAAWRAAVASADAWRAPAPCNTSKHCCHPLESDKTRQHKSKQKVTHEHNAWWWVLTLCIDDVSVNNAARMPPIWMPGQLGVNSWRPRHPPVLDNQQLLAVEGSKKSTSQTSPHHRRDVKNRGVTA